MKPRLMVGAVLSACALLASGGASVKAEPTEPPFPSPPVPTATGIPPPATRAVALPTIAWRQFGRPETLELRGADLDNKIEIPVPKGMTAAVISGQIESAVNVDAGRIDVFDGRDNAVGTIPIPLEVPAAPFTLNTSAAAIESGRLTLNFVLRSADPPGDTCAPTPTVTLSRLATALAGRPSNPATIADFLPSYLDTITIWTGPTPTADQQQAALTLTAMLTRNYRPLPVRIDVDTSATLPKGDPLARRIIAVRDSETNGIEVRDPGTPQAVLTISGRGLDLVEQIAAFVDSRRGLAQTGSAVVQSATGPLNSSSTIMTFEQLGIAISNSFTGASSTYLGLDGAAFAAGPIVKATVDLRARYTPTGDDKASLLIKSGSYVLATRRLDQSGELDLKFEIPPQTITSDIGMALELQYFPGGGTCAPLIDRMTFALDPQSTVEITSGAVGSAGFTSLPAAFTPEFNVAVDRPEYIRYAAQAINLIGQRTATLLRPQLTSMDNGAAEKLGLLAVTVGDGVSRMGMRPPVTITADGQVGVDGETTTSTVLNGPVGIVQSFAQNDRTVLAIDVPDRAELVDETFDYIRQLDNGWSSLAGDVVATGSAGETVELTVRSDRPVPGRTIRREGWKWTALATIVAGAAATAAAARVLTIRRRQTRQAQE